MLQVNGEIPTTVIFNNNEVTTIKIIENGVETVVWTKPV